MSQTVLMADDSIPLHALVRAQLEQDDLKLESAYNGDSALAMAASILPSLILLDIDMPKQDGFNVCRSLKANPATASVPLVFLTADSILESKVKGLDLGAVDYITKPFKPQEFRARVRSALRSQHADVGMAMVDPQTGLRSRAYLEAHLPAMLTMARQSGRPLSCIVGSINNFQPMSQQHGKTIGGEVQRAVGQIFQGHCRGDDILGRVDAGKFAILLSVTSSATAIKIAERLGTDVERRMRFCAGVEMNVTCSFGVADTLGAPEEADLIGRASAAEQRAWQLGPGAAPVSRLASPQPRGNA